MEETVSSCTTEREERVTCSTSLCSSLRINNMGNEEHAGNRSATDTNILTPVVIYSFFLRQESVLAHSLSLSLQLQSDLMVF